MFETISLSTNIWGEKYEQFLDSCFELSTYFSFTKSGYHDESDLYLAFLDELAPSYIQTVHTSHWFCYYVLPTKPLEVCLYHADNEMKYIIKRYFNNIFQQEMKSDGTWGNVMNLPEDICFFQDKQLLLGTVSHENICYLYPPNESIKMQFMKLGVWKQKEYRSAEHIIIEL